MTNPRTTALSLLFTAAMATAILGQVTTPPPGTPLPQPTEGTSAPPTKTAGMMLVEAEKYEEGLARLELELKESPKRVELHQAKVDALMGLARFADARNAALQGLFADPPNGSLRLDLGRCSYELGQMDQAIQAWKPLLTNPAWRQVVLAWTVRAMRTVGKEKEAKEMVMAELASNPSPIAGVLLQALVLDPSVENGLKYIDKLAEVDPESKSDYLAMKTLYQQMGTGEVCEVVVPTPPTATAPVIIPLKEKSEVVYMNALTWNNKADITNASTTRVVLPVNFTGTAAKKEWMLVDSGADNFLISGYMVKKLGLQPVATAQYVGLGYKGAMASNWVIVKEMQIGSVTVKNVPAMVIEKEDDFWKETAGIIPLTVLRHFAIYYERRKGNFALYPSGTPPETVCGARTLTAPFLWAGRNPYVQVRIGTSPPVFFLLDTGAFATFVDARRAPAYGLKLNLKYGAQNITGMSGGVQSGVATDTILQLGTGRVTLRGVQVADLGSGWVLDCPGILGRDILDLFALYIDYQQNRLIFDPYDR